MKKLAKLVLFFSLSFIIIFLASTGIRYLSLQVEWAQNLPQEPGIFPEIIFNAAQWAISLAMYASILLCLSYTARRSLSTPVSIIFITILSLIFNFGFSFALNNWKPAQSGLQKQMDKTSSIQLGENGLLLSNSLNKNESAIILLKGMAEPLGPRVIAAPDRPLIYQEASSTANANLPPVPFGTGLPWFINGLFIDLKQNAEQLKLQFQNGVLPFLIYTGALIFFLSSLGFIIKLSVWPLAGLFLGILAFRGILAFESFLNSPEIQNFFESILGSFIPVTMTVPVIFIVISLLIHTYSILLFISKRHGKNDD
jgi:hypothetical protein